MDRFEQLFRLYEAALNRGDGEAVAACYADRFLHLARRGASWVHDWRLNDEGFRAALSRAGRWYGEQGARRFAVRKLVKDEVRPSHSLARVSWEVLDASGARIVAFDATFMVRLREPHGAIVALVAHNERRRLAESGRCVDPADLYFDLPASDVEAVSGLRRSPAGRRDAGRAS